MQRIAYKTPAAAARRPAAAVAAPPVAAQAEALGMQQRVGNSRRLGQGRGAVRVEGVRAIVQRAQAPRGSTQPAASAARAAGDLFFRAPGQRAAKTGVPRPMARHNGEANAVIQRLAVDDDPFPNVWPAAGVNMTRSGDGTTGVFFATSPAGRVAIKLLEPQVAFRSQVADRFMQMGTRVAVPGSRVFAAGSPGNISIRQAILAHANLPGADARFKQMATLQAGAATNVVIVMEHVPLVSLRDLARNPAQHQNLTQALVRPSVIEGFAKIFVADAIMGNTDRFLKDLAFDAVDLQNPVNLSNIFLAPTHNTVVALDNDTDKAEALSPAAMNNLDVTLQRRNFVARALARPFVADEVADLIVCACMQDAGELAPAAVTPMLWQTGVGPFSDAVRQGNVRNMLAHLLRGALQRQMDAVTSDMRTQKNQLRAAHAQSAAAVGFTQQQAQANIDYNLLRARAKYVKLLAEGKGQVAALAGERKQLLHKQEKDNRQLGYQKAEDAVSSGVKKFTGLFTK